MPRLERVLRDALETVVRKMPSKITRHILAVVVCVVVLVGKDTGSCRNLSLTHLYRDVHMSRIISMKELERLVQDSSRMRVSLRNFTIPLNRLRLPITQIEQSCQFDRKKY